MGPGINKNGFLANLVQFAKENDTNKAPPRPLQEPSPMGGLLGSNGNVLIIIINVSCKAALTKIVNECSSMREQCMITRARRA